MAYENAESCLGRLCIAARYQVFGLVTLVKYDDAIERLASEPLQYLAQPRVVLLLSCLVLAFADERRVGGKNYAFFYA